MRSSFLYTLLITLVSAGGYFLYTALTICPVPITYRIGELDDRFGLTAEAAKDAIAEAAAVWEQAAGRDLFSYADAADVTVNFIYDDRQQLADAESSVRDELDAAEQVNADINERYATLVTAYDDLQVAYEARVKAYEQKLAKYNAVVAEYNKTGGAPTEVFQELRATEQSLDADRVRLEADEAKLNTLVVEINSVSEKGNSIVEQYNAEVHTYNDTFGKKREFTQGTYDTAGRIDVYSFVDREELKLVLAHELGHALSIDHVSGSESVMYFLIGEQPKDLKLAPADIAAFSAVCGEGTLWDTIQEKINYVF